jgi:hypothetical protein
MCSSSAAADARGGAVNRRAREYARDHLRAVRTAGDAKLIDEAGPELFNKD